MTDTVVTLTVDGEAISTTVHATEDDALRHLFDAFDPEGECGGDLQTLIDTMGIAVYIDTHKVECGRAGTSHKGPGMIMLTQDRRDGQADELIFVAPQHVVTVKAEDVTTDCDGQATRAVVGLAGGGVLFVTEDRDEVVEMIEAALNGGDK